MGLVSKDIMFSRTLVGRKLDMSGWGGACPVVLTGVGPTLPSDHLSMGSSAASRPPGGKFGASSFNAQTQRKKYDLNGNLLGP